jgi:hypothetical protein
MSACPPPRADLTRVNRSTCSPGRCRVASTGMPWGCRGSLDPAKANDLFSGLLRQRCAALLRPRASIRTLVWSVTSSRSNRCVHLLRLNLSKQRRRGVTGGVDGVWRPSTGGGSCKVDQPTTGLTERLRELTRRNGSIAASLWTGTELGKTTRLFTVPTGSACPGGLPRRPAPPGHWLCGSPRPIHFTAHQAPTR